MNNDTGSCEDMLLMIPGPTNIPESVRLAMAAQCIYHRGSEFAALLDDCIRGLQQVIGTARPVAILTASGTGGVEAAVANLLQPGDRLLALNTGKFGKRIGDIATLYGAEVTWWDCPPGGAASPALLKRVLAQGYFTAVSFVYNETSTGVMHDIAGLGRIAHDAGALSIVDAVSVMGAAPIDMDANGLDAVIGGSQKALMLPPGLSFVALSEAALEKACRTNRASYYFDLPRALAAIEKGQTPYTPAVTLMSGLREALRMILEEGLDAVFSRHAALARACRSALDAMGLPLLPTDRARCSVTVTAAHAPEGMDSKELVTRVRDDSHILISGGQDELKGKVFRIGHMGDCGIAQLARTISAVGAALGQLGVAVDAAAAAAVARDEYTRHQENPDA